MQTCRGSHTHTLVTDPKDTANIYIYGSGTGPGPPGRRAGRLLEQGAGRGSEHGALQHRRDQGAAGRAGAGARSSTARASSPIATTGAIAGLEKGGDRGPGTQAARVTNQCHDITVYPAIGLAAGACSGNGILLDISDPVNPVRLDAASDKNFAYWHSATFNNDGTKVIFTDEWGGGTRRAAARPISSPGAPTRSSTSSTRSCSSGSYFKMPAAQTDQENCVAHNGSLIPVPGRDIMVQGWYQGGVSMFDFTDSAHPGRDRVLRSRPDRRRTT